MTINRKQIVNGAIIFTLILLAGGSLAAVNAATAETTRVNNFGGRNFANLTEAQKTEMQAQRDEQIKLREAERALVQAALDKGDYQAWLAAVGTANPLAQKITAENFPKFVEAHKLREQANQIMSDLGLEGLGLGQMGMGQGGPGRGQHRGFMAGVQGE